MMKSIFYSFFALILIDFYAYAQEDHGVESPDSLLSRAEAMKFSQPDSARQIGEKALEVATEIGNDFVRGKANQLLSRIYAELGDYTLAIEAVNEAIPIFQDLKEEKELCTTYLHKGVIYRYLKLYDESISEYQNAETIAKENNLDGHLAGIYGNMGNVFFDKGDLTKALEYHQNSLQIDMARGNDQGVGNTHHNIGMIYKARKEYEQALDNFEKSLAVDIKKNNARNIVLSYVEFISLYAEMGDYPKAYNYAQQALVVSDKLQSDRLTLQVLAYMPLLEASLGKKDMALLQLERYKSLNDSLIAAQLQGQIAEMQARFDTEQKDIALQEQQSSLQQQRYLLLGLVFIFLLSLLLAWLLFNRFKLRQQNRQLSLQYERFQLSQSLQLRYDIDDTINYFATSLFGKNSEDEILWDIAKNCISRLGFVDCVIYMIDEEKKVLIQNAAYGAKTKDDFKIVNPIKIPVGEGIVGHVAKTAVAENIVDTRQDARYIKDDEMRLSELAVPIILHEKVIGIIDSEHPEKGFFQEHHVEALKTIAAICASKITQARADEEAHKAKIMQLEADNIKKLDQLKSEFFANISHEFRTPLHLILAPLKKQPADIVPDELSMIERNAQKLLMLVNQLLDLAKVEVGILKLEYQESDFIKFLNQHVNGFESLAESRGIIFQVDIPDRDLPAFFDPDKVGKIIYNLISNAIKFTPAGGKVTFHAAIESTDNIRIVVTDTGLGIPEESQEKIFERFYQVDGTQTRRHEGTGIGLALTKEFVDLCQGTIRVNSVKGRGSSFEVILPLFINVERAHKQQYTETLPFYSELLSDDFRETEPRDLLEEKNTVLLVEDNNELRHYLMRQLNDRYNIILASQGEEGYSKAKERIPDLVISDVMMPGVDGLTFTQWLKEDPLTSHIPLILLTARDDIETKTSGFDKGADQYLVKPFEVSELLARIESLLRHRERLQKKYSREVFLQPTATKILDKEAEFLEKAINIIEEHMSDENFTVEMLQKNIGMSRMQLHRKLKALTNQSATDFIRSIRLKRAAYLLQKSDMQVAEAAYLSGFGHLSYFAKRFREMFGLSPSDYREKYSKKAT